jgi:hypothetical protein
MNLTSILSEIKAVPAGVAGGLFPGDVFGIRYFKKNDNGEIEWEIEVVDKVKETPLKYKVFTKMYHVTFDLNDISIDIKEEPVRVELYKKDIIDAVLAGTSRNKFSNLNNISKLSGILEYFKEALFEKEFEEKIDIKTLKRVVSAFVKYNKFSSVGTYEEFIENREKIFQKAYNELKVAEEKTKGAEDTVKNIKDTIDWLESQALEFLQKYTNADMSTYKKS